MGGRAVASAFKDLFLPPHQLHSREQIFNSGWNPQRFPPQRTEAMNSHIKGRRKASLLLKQACIKQSIADTAFINISRNIISVGL
ncbi:hypothetical protein J2Z66_005698 [Paenibacillus eucommiae]|uniref:Uncharacterized protein n=1 Tax=Paenibacillus eucommiae TaxID=1355755 RepID=A0ABS4J2K6_9BACL|nr:hypothetical protein [Paenibacillus eucommiae]